ncbi:MAG: type III secretion protein [Oscillibacter sp.]|nr:type III secretion protein [Oscillibacter sp.]
MSFSTLRPGSPIYILNKGGVPTVEIGTIVSVTTPAPQFGLPQTMTVDLMIKVGDKTGPFPKVPAHAEVDEYKNNGVPTQYVLATNKDAMNAEVNSLRQQAVGIINSVDHNRQVITACDEMLKQLNPEYAEKQKQEAEIAELRTQLATQQSQMAELISLLKGRDGSNEEELTKNK